MCQGSRGGGTRTPQFQAVCLTCCRSVHYPRVTPLFELPRIGLRGVRGRSTHRLSPMLRPDISGPRRAGTATGLGVKSSAPTRPHRQSSVGGCRARIELPSFNACPLQKQAPKLVWTSPLRIMQTSKTILMRCHRHSGLSAPAQSGNRDTWI